MLTDTVKPMNAAQKAWATRRARDAARADIVRLNAGVETPAVAYRENKPVVDINIDDAKVGCGTRRFVVLDCGPRVVRLFYYPTLVTITVDRLTFDRKAKYARDSKREKIAAIIRKNQKLADTINGEARKIVVPDGGADAVKALEMLR
jgi:hypothetical protein